MKQQWLARILFYREEQVAQAIDLPFAEGGQTLRPAGAPELRIQMKQGAGRSVKLTAAGGRAEQIGLALVCRLEEWGDENYLLMPGAVYNGNRFPVYPCAYPPFRYGGTACEKDGREMITDIPHLDRRGGKIQFHAGDMAEPVIGLACGGEGLLLRTEQRFGGCETGIAFLETADAAEAVFTVPSVKESKYRITKCGFPSGDRAPSLEKGQSLYLEVKSAEFRCPGVQALFDALFDLREEWNPDSQTGKFFPFGNCAEILEEKFNRTDWVEAYGYYSMGPRPGYERAWVLGWPGMMMYPMLLNGSPLTVQRALRNIDYLVRVTQAPTGFFYASAGGNECFGDCFEHREWKNWLLLRRNADALFYLAKCLLVIREKGISYDVPRLETAIRRCADAFVTLYRRYGQCGQFVDADTGEILIPNTCSAALSTGALALCGKIFENPAYLETAGQIASDYYEQYVSRGLTTGGPGEILQAPDSESAYGMTAGFVTLYQVTGKRIWLERAEEMAKQFATWCMPYHYTFPKTSEFGRLEMRTAGTVFANAQNKHSAPGICTHSGFELLQLYRDTGDLRYLRLIREIAGAIPQYLSRNERPIHARGGKILPHGWMHERVNTSDWEGDENIGMVYYGNCWCSVSLMMTCAEIPGVYVRPDRQVLCAIDHVCADWMEGRRKIRIQNPTRYDTSVSVWVDRGEETPVPALSYRKAFCPAGAAREISLE